MTFALPADLIVRVRCRVVTASRMPLHVQALATGIGGRCYSHPAARSYDAMIAATARAFGLTVATRDLRDFAECGVRLVDPWSAEPD